MSSRQKKYICGAWMSLSMPSPLREVEVHARSAEEAEEKAEKFVKTQLEALGLTGNVTIEVTAEE